MPAPETVVREFLTAIERGDVDAALALLTEDARWINVSLPEIRGRERIGRVCRWGLERGRFGVHFHNVASEGDVVLTERTDELRIGPLAHRFWVYGRFEIRDGRIAVWRDSFDWGDMLVGLLRGILGAISPSLNRPWPGGPPAS